MSGFMGIGGSAAKTDRKQELKGFGDLSNVFNFAMPTATNLSASGSGGLDSSMAYFKSIMSGNRSTMMAAQAPAINATLASGDAAKRQAATSGTARGGGTAGTNQQADEKTGATIDNALFAARPAAAKEVGQLGNAELSDALNALGIAGNTAGDITSLASSSRSTSNAITRQAIGDVASVAGAVLGGFGL